MSTFLSKEIGPYSPRRTAGWRREKREEEYILFSKSGFTDRLKDISDSSVSLYSLDDMEEFF